MFKKKVKESGSGVRNAGTGTIVINEGTEISSNASHTIENQDSGKIQITGGTIKYTSEVIEQENGKETVVSCAIQNGRNGTTSTTGTTGTIEITGGTVISENSIGINILEGTLTIGTNEDENTEPDAENPNTTEPSTTNPSITGATNGVNIANGATFNFYDGVIKGTKAINGNVSATPSGYIVNETTTDSIETAILVKQSSSPELEGASIETNNILENSIKLDKQDSSTNYEIQEQEINIEQSGIEEINVDENKESINNEQSNNLEDKGTLENELKIAQINNATYSTITEAINAANNGDTIVLLENINLTEEITIKPDKNIIIKMNGKTITGNLANIINNKGILKIIGSGTIRNDQSNGVVIFNTGELNVENTVITTAQNSEKGIYNNQGSVTVKGGKVVTQGIGSIGIYNIGGANSKSTDNSDLILGNTIIEVTGAGSKCIYNDGKAEIKDGSINVSADDSIGIYNGVNAGKLCISENTEITLKPDEIENYDLIKNTNEFKAELENIKSSYGIYNYSKNGITIEKANIKVERLKGIGIANKSEGTITLGKDDENYASASPIIYTISENTNAIENSGKGSIKFYDGRLVTLNSVKDILTTDKYKYEIAEEIGENIIRTVLKFIEHTGVKEPIKTE